MKKKNKKKIAIKIKNLTVAYKNDPILLNFNIEFKKNKLTAIVGPNGAGKTTLIKTIMNLIKPIAGKIKIFNKNKKIGYVPQINSVNWDFPATVEEIIMMGRYNKIGWLNKIKKKDYYIVNNIIKKINMSKYKKKQINELSKGQQQRVFLARALAQEADIYILDEPFESIDIKTKNILMRLIKKIGEKKTFIIVHHDFSTIPKYFENIVFMNKQLIAYGNVKNTLNKKNFKKTYENL